LAESVVDVVETIEIQQQQSGRSPGAALADRPVHPLGQCAAVGQPGKGVMHREVGELALQLLLLGHGG
jgi:hypothetical protein